MSVWNPDNIRDVAEATGINNLNHEVVEYLTRDVEFRLGQVIEKALKFMTHAKRTTMHTQDIALALRAFDIEPLYGYDSTRPLRFGEATIGVGQPLFFVEDEEVEFEKLINAPLPKVPRDISYTAHWLAVEGVQPSIPQNPSSGEAKVSTMLPKGPANSTLAAMAGLDSTNSQIKPATRHILSKELQLYFDRVSNAIFDSDNDTFRNAAFSSLRSDPGLQQLVPYFVQFVAEKVTHNLNNLFVLYQACTIVDALTTNPSLYLDPYVHAMVAPVFTCLTGKHLGGSTPTAQQEAIGIRSHLDVRDFSASLLAKMARKYSSSNRALKARLARSCLRKWLDPHKPLGTNYGGFLGIVGIGGSEVVRHVVLPNLALYDSILLEAATDKNKQADVQAMTVAIIKALELLVDGESALDLAINGPGPDVDLSSPIVREQLVDRLGRIVGTLICEQGPERKRLISLLMRSEFDL